MSTKGCSGGCASGKPSRSSRPGGDGRTSPSWPRRHASGRSARRSARITDARLGGSPGLEALILSRVSRTDAGLAHLAPLRASLRRLDSTQTLIAPAGVATFRLAAPPALVIEHLQVAPTFFR